MDRRTPLVMSRVLRRAAPALLAVLACVAGGCHTPLLDSPSSVRQTEVFVPPLYTSSASADGTSHEWSALFWLLGAEAEGPRRSARALPFWWTTAEDPWREQTLLFPLWYERETSAETWRFWSLLYGSIDSQAWDQHYIVGPVFRWGSAKESDDGSANALLLFDWARDGDLTHLTLVPALGLVHLAAFDLGYPGEGVLTPALGRDASRRVEFLNALGIVSLFGWDDVGDRRDARLLTLFGFEDVSLFRSYVARDPEDPYRRSHLFPLYLDHADDEGSTTIVGPLWGQFHDEAEASTTDWWLLGLLSRTRQEAGTAWKVLGLTVVGP